MIQSVFKRKLRGQTDVDAVSIATFDIDRNGKLNLWSPYANLESLAQLEASMELPIPTGKAFKFEMTYQYKKSVGFFSKYAPILEINRQILDDQGTVSPTELEVRIKDRLSVAELRLLKEFLLEAEDLKVPHKNYQEQFINELNATGFAFGMLAPKHIPSLYKGIKQVIDNHNLYYDSIETYKLSQITNNSTMYNTWLASRDPVNLLQAHMSVDATTGALKDIANDPRKTSKAEDALNRGPGNFVNAFEAIVENHTGKKGISICATGLKSFFALTQYANYLLNNGTVDEQGRLLLGPDHKGITIGGKTYTQLANIRAIDINTIKNSELFKQLSKITQDEDVALTLSALLSLATDNAKELALDKLNAGTKMLGMYVYGLTIGMDFETIADILMSPVGNTIRELLDDDKFSRRDAFGVIDDRIFEYFTKGPGQKFLSKYDIFQDSKGNKIEGSRPIATLTNLLKKEYPGLTDKKGKPAKLRQLIAHMGKDYKKSRQEKLDILESWRQSTIQNPEAREVYNQLIDFVQQYIIQADVIWKNESTFNDIETLSRGAQEMKLLGQILSINQGLKTSSPDFLQQMNNLRRAIYNNLDEESRSLDDIVDLVKFAMDENPYSVNGIEYPTYRDYVIDYYEEVKEAFNIFDVVSKVPHFMGYIKELATAKTELDSAFTFRSMDTLLLPVKNKLGEFIKEDKLARGLQNFCGDWLIKRWMLDTQRPIIIPAGNKAFDKNGNIYTLTQDTPFLLGTDWGNATFRMWMENEVIPNLKNGIITPGKTWSGISNNRFIQDLTTDVYNRTISRNKTIIYTLPINMLPSTDAERNIFNQYKSQFNALKMNYQYQVKEFQDGKEVTRLEERLITDLFTYYAMIANNWRQDQSSLVSITEDLQNTGIIDDLHNYISEIDKSGFTLTLDNVIFDDLLPYVAPNESPYSSMSEFIYARNSKTQKRVLMKKLDYKTARAEREAGNENVFGQYRANDPMQNLRYFGTGRVSQSEGVENVSIDGHNVKVKYDATSYKILRVSGLDEKQLKKLQDNLKEVPTMTLDKAKVPDNQILRAMINHILNEC